MGIIFWTCNARQQDLLPFNECRSKFKGEVGAAVGIALLLLMIITDFGH